MCLASTLALSQRLGGVYGEGSWANGALRVEGELLVLLGVVETWLFDVGNCFYKPIGSVSR